MSHQHIPLEPRSDPGWRVILIGASTGGVEALKVVLSGFPGNCPPTLIAQHMPEKYLRSFTKRLNQEVLPEVLIARDGQPIEQGRVYIAPGGATHLAISAGNNICCQLCESDKVNGYRPSIDVLFSSATTIANSVVAILLTGMGSDGAQGLLALRKAGAFTVVQDKASCRVYGMPRAAVALGAAIYQTELQQIAAQILLRCSRPKDGVFAGGAVK